MKLSGLKDAREEKLAKIKKIGLESYAAFYAKRHMIFDAIASEGQVVKTAGRIVSFREHGDISFADLKDETGKIQIFFKKDLLGNEAYENLGLLDIGDFIGVEGEVVKTIAGEISIAPTSYTLLTKALRPLPSEWFGIKDIETRYRQRYLDLLLNPEVRKRFNIRTKLISGIREYLDELGFWEVETPVLQVLYGGANAKPFKTHVNALDQDVYLRIADELYLKRLIIGGYEKVYEICKDFRNEGIDQTHFPEFTMIEWYEAYADYIRVMDVAEGLFKYLAKKLYGHTILEIENKKVDIGKKWPRIEMTTILKEKLGLDVEKETKDSLRKYINENIPDAQLVGGENNGQLIFIIFEHKIPKLLEEPTWIIDYPEEVSPLAKQHRSKPGWVERFEGYIGGREIADGFSELVDPKVQRKRFTEDFKAVRKDKEEAQQVDEDFLTAMEYGMPPLGGVGVGIDRLTMFFTNTWVIKEMILFPTLKVDLKDTDKTSENINPDKETSSFKRPEIFSIDKSVKEKFPSVSIGIAVIKNVHIEKMNEKLEKEKEQLLKLHESLTTEQLGKFPEIISYRRLYKETGIDWHSRRPSPEALLRRVALKKGLYTVNTCVDAYNLVVMKNRVSVGAFDFDKVQFPTRLSLAKEREKILLLGDMESTSYKNGEVAYFDKEGGYNIDFNYRDAQRTAVQITTKNIYVNVDGVYDITPEKVEKVLKEACDKIIEHCGGTLEVFGVETASG